MAGSHGTVNHAEFFTVGSNPVGSNSIDDFDDRNIDLMTFRDSWTQAAGPRENYPSRWLHSDAKDVALRFNRQLYTDWITRGNLQ